MADATTKTMQNLMPHGSRTDVKLTSRTHISQDPDGDDHNTE
jgi:hypothetical protein